MNEAPSNHWPVNQAALAWLREANASPQEGASYLAQLAAWGLEKGVVEVPRPESPNQPERHNLESAVDALLGSGLQEAAFASRWFLSNPNLSREEQEEELARQLKGAESPRKAALVVVETNTRMPRGGMT